MRFSAPVVAFACLLCIDVAFAGNSTPILVAPLSSGIMAIAGLLGVASWALLIAGVVLAYVMLVRPVLKKRAELAPFFAEEASLFERWGGYLRGLKTKLSAWFLIIAGALLEAHDFLAPIVAGVDTTSLTSQVPSWAWPVIMIAIAALFRWLRKVTTGPEAG